MDILIIELVESAKSAWQSFGAPLSATFIGACLAFSSAFLIQYLQRRRDQYGSLAEAMETLRTQMDDFRNFSFGFQAEVGSRLEGANAGVPKWSIARPVVFYFFDDLKFDYAKLSFLVEKGHPDTVARLRYADRRYHELKLYAEQYNEMAAKKHERMGPQFPVGTQATVAQVAAAVGPDVTGALDTLIGALEAHSTSDMRDYEAAEIALSESTLKLFPRRPKLGIVLEPLGQTAATATVPIGIHAGIQELVNEEVSRQQTAAVARLAELDRNLLLTAEQPGDSSRDRGEKAIALLQKKRKELEEELREATEAERPIISLVLRDVYHRLLTQARQHFASGPGYQQVRDEVLRGLGELAMSPEKYAAILAGLGVNRHYAVVESPDGSLWQFRLVPKNGGPSPMVVIDDEFLNAFSALEVGRLLSDWNVVERAAGAMPDGLVVVGAEGVRVVPRGG